MKHTGFTRIIKRAVLPAALLLFGGDVSAQSPTQCAFWGVTTRYRGALVTSSDQIRAYDPRGQLCGEATGSTTAGGYLIYVHGVYDGSPFPGGAAEGEAITFKINGETAGIVSGSNIWHNNASYQCELAVDDQPPQSEPGGPYYGNEGSSVQFDGSASSGVTYTWSFGDGGTGSGVSPAHTYTDNGTYTVTLTVQNGSGQAHSKSTSAIISNVNPVVNAGPDKTANEGEPVTFSGSATDAGTEDRNQGFTWLWNFGDGGSASSVTATHTYRNNGVYTATLYATDKDGGQGSDQATVTVFNVPPRNVNAGSDKTGVEGQQLQFSGYADDPGVDDVLVYSWNFGDGHSATGQNVSHAYGDNGTYTVTLTVSDGDDSASDQLTAVISNAPPVAHAGGPYTIVINETVQFNGSVTDPGFNDTHTFEWDLDNDGQYDDYTGRYPTRTYTAAGTFPVSLRVTDKDGDWGIDNTTVNVSAGVKVTVTARPEGRNLKVYINGELHTTPKILYLQTGTQLSLEAPWDQYIGSGTRYHYMYWTGGGGRAQTVTVPGQSVTYEANYLKQFEVTIDTRDVNADTDGEGWYAEGEPATVNVAPEAVGANGDIKYTFSSWSGSGLGGYTGPDRQATFLVYGPIVQTVNWAEQYYLQVLSSLGTTSGTGWYQHGEQAWIEVEYEEDESGGSRSSFKSWSGEGEGAYSGPDNPAAVTVNGPITQTAQWATQYKLDLVTEFGTAQGEGWYDAGSTAQVTIDTSVVMPAGTRAGFLRWQGVGTGSYTGPDCDFEIVINAPVTEIAQWKIQYYLTLESERGNPQGEGWYDKGTMVSWSIEPGIQITTDERYGFWRWAGTGTGSYTGTERVPSIIMQGPITETAEWRGQYFISTSVTPANSGTIQAFPPPGGWGNADTLNRFLAIGDADSGYGFLKWSGDADSYLNPFDLYLDSPKQIIAEFIQGKIRINTSPSGLRAQVDGSEGTAPIVFNWPSGETHQVGVPTPQGDGFSSRFEFREWSDGGAREHQVTAPDTSITYIAYFDEFYYVSLVSDYGSPDGEGWYAVDSSAVISIDSVYNETERVRWKFTGWQGSGSGGITTGLREISLTVGGPITQRALWEPQFSLKLDKFPSYAPGVDITVDPPGPWYDPGQPVRLGVVIEDPNYTFTGWSGDVEGSAPELTVIVDAPLNIVANFYTPNLPPQVGAFPQIYIAENQVFQKSFNWLSQFVYDDNDPLKYLEWEYETDGSLTLEIDTVNSLFRIVPEEFWHGSAVIDFTVTDPFGLRAEGRIQVIVVPVDNPPQPFSLIAPASDSVFSEWSWSTKFLWERSENVDPGDSIIYTFYLGDNESLTGSNTFAASFLPDTSLMVFIQTPGDFYWAVWAEDRARNRTRCQEVYKVTLDTAVPDKEEAVTDYHLYQNYPNPFNPETQIRYSLPKAGDVSLKIYNALGQVVCTLVDAYRSGGTHQVTWNGRDSLDRPAASGLYLIRIECGTFVEKRKMLLVR